MARRWETQPTPDGPENEGWDSSEESPISRMLSRIESRADHVNQTLVTLGQRLAPVIVHRETPKPSLEAKDRVAKRVCSPMLEQLEQISCRLEAAAETIAYYNESLQL